MGAKTWMMVYSPASARQALGRKPALDRGATAAWVQNLFPRETLEPLEDGNLFWTCPPNKEICAGCFDGVAVVAAKEFGIDYPSKMPRAFIDAAGGGTATLHAMHSVVDWCAFAHWRDGKLIRSLSVSPDSGVMEDIGDKMEFEMPFWSGANPVGDSPEEEHEYPLPFHPLELAEAALEAFFGYQLEGYIDAEQLQPEDIPLLRFKRRRPFWKLW